MRASSRRYVPAPDRHVALPARIGALAYRHRRYGAGMIDLTLRQAGERVHHKRVDRLDTAARLQVRRRRRQKGPVAERQPLVRPTRPNEVWSADFVFDRTAHDRSAGRRSRVGSTGWRWSAACPRCCARTTRWSAADE